MGTHSFVSSNKIANWKTWKAQSDLECLAKSRYQSKAITLHIALKKLLEAVEGQEHKLTLVPCIGDLNAIKYARIILDTIDPF